MAVALVIKTTTREVRELLVKDLQEETHLLVILFLQKAAAVVLLLLEEMDKQLLVEAEQIKVVTVEQVHLLIHLGEMQHQQGKTFQERVGMQEVVAVRVAQVMAQH